MPNDDVDDVHFHWDHRAPYPSAACLHSLLALDLEVQRADSLHACHKVDRLVVGTCRDEEVEASCLGESACLDLAGTVTVDAVRLLLG